MSRILKAPFINLNNSDSIVIDNHIKITNDYSDEMQIQQDIQQEIVNVARKQSEIIISNAKNQAKNILEKAESQANEKVEQAKITFEQQKKQGYEDGINSAKEEAEKIVNEANQILENAKIEKENIQNETIPEMVNLVLDIAHNILSESFNINPEIISFLIKKGLQNVKQLSNLNIIVSEEQFEFVRDNLQKIINVDFEKNNISVLKDSSFANSDCSIETDFGTIKCDLDEQLSGIKNVFSHILKN